MPHERPSTHLDSERWFTISTSTASIPILQSVSTLLILWHVRYSDSSRGRLGLTVTSKLARHQLLTQITSPLKPQERPSVQSELVECGG
jgi:hypothetical protein